MRGETQVSPQVLLSLPQLVDGQCQISLSKAEVQGALEKLNIDFTDLPGLRLYVAAAIIESPGEWLPDCNPRLSPLTSELTLCSPALTPLPSLLTLIWDPKPEKTQKTVSPTALLGGFWGSGTFPLSVRPFIHLSSRHIRHHLCAGSRVGLRKQRDEWEVACALRSSLSGGQEAFELLPQLSCSSSWVSLLHLSRPHVLQGERWRRQSSHPGVLCHLPSPWILATPSDTSCLGPPFCCRFFLEAERELGGGCWSGGPKASLTTLFSLPAPTHLGPGQRHVGLPSVWHSCQRLCHVVFSWVCS